MKKEVLAALVAVVVMGACAAADTGGVPEVADNESTPASKPALRARDPIATFADGVLPHASGTGGAAPDGTAGGAGGGSGVVAPAAFTKGPSGCTAMTLESKVSVGGYVSDRYRWSDGSCRPRAAALVRNDAADPGGSHGGYLRELSYELNGSPMVARGTGVNGWMGWGYVVNHYASSADVSKDHTGTFRTVFAGAHHAIHEFKVRMSPGGPLDATVHWFFATGRSSPVYFITYDATAAGPNTLVADSRAPYGDLAFEGAIGSIGGVAWGDKYRFTTTSVPVTPATGWDYTQPNIVPYVRLWSQNVDAEMGAVQTQSWEQQPAGGDYVNGLLGAACWGRTSATQGSGCSASGWTMPQDYLWPFQLNQYELPATDTSHRLAWGMTYGAIGKTSYQAFGKTLSGYPTVAYSVLMTVGPKSAEATMAQVTEIEHALSAQVTGATWDPSYAVWHASMTGNRATVTMNPLGGALSTPIFRFTGFTGMAPAHVTLDGQETSAYFASVDPATQTLWLTLNGTLTGPVSLQVE
jgi:hypothetical protein